MATSAQSVVIKSASKDEVKEKKDTEVVSQLSKILENYKRTRSSFLVRKYRSLKEFVHFKPVSDDDISAISKTVTAHPCLNKFSTNRHLNCD